MTDIILDPTAVPTDWDTTQVDDFGTVHFIGIGGAGMSVLAEILHGMGVDVQGSDRERSAKTDRLEQLGIRVFIGQRAEHVAHAHIVVWSSAIKADNPEIIAAAQQGSVLWHRSDVLAWLMRARKAVTVAGAHGKTTTSAMIATIITHAGQGALADPSYAIGGSLQSAHGHTDGGHAGKGSVFVAEADESDGSFVKYRPQVAVITNIEAEHLDHYGDEAHYIEAFVAHAQHAQRAVVLCGDDANSWRLLQNLSDDEAAHTVIVTTEDAQVFAAHHERELRGAHIVSIEQERERTVEQAAGGIVESCVVHLPQFVTGAQERSVTLQLRVPGVHNARNAAQAVVASVLLGVSAQAAAQALTEFYGAARRFEIRGVVDGITVVDDYSHHPTEIAALLHAARRRFPHANIRVLFQPHLYSRTKFFAQNFASALALADDVIVTGIFAAREQASDYPDINAATIVKYASTGQHIEAGSDMHEDAVRLAGRAQSGDVLITVGAGDITNMASVILTALQRRK